MNESLLKLYRQHANSEEAFAILFVKKNLLQSKGHWIDIISFQRYRTSTDNMHFKFVFGGLFKRKIQPKYPDRSLFSDDRSYYLMARAITWDTARIDIGRQKERRIKPVKFEIKGVTYDKNRNKKSYFSDDAPVEIKALENNLNDRTDPLWDKAINYIIEPEFVYEVKKARIIPTQA